MTQIFLPPHQAWTFARLPDILDDFAIPAGTVLHIGAHHGEEVAIYRQCGFTTIRLVEPDPDNVAVLGSRFGTDDDIDIIPAAVVPAAEVHFGLANLHRAERSVWSGLHPHPTATGETVQVSTVSMSVVQTGEDVLVLDTQGSELDLLRAADLSGPYLVIVETTRRRGDGAAFYDDAVSYMRQQGFWLVEEWVHDGSGYTDTVFVPGPEA